MKKKLMGILLVGVLISGGIAMAKDKVLIIRSGDCEFLPLMDRLKIEYTVTDRIEDISKLSEKDYSAAIVCSLNYPKPTSLSKENLKILKSFVERGGRLFLEFPKPPEGESVFGINFEPSTKRLFYERIYASNSHFVVSGLEPKTIFEEHNSAMLPVKELSSDVKEILTYARVFGTYAVTKESKPSCFEVTINLGKEAKLDKVCQYYGAGQSNYYPEKVEVYTSMDGNNFTLQKTVLQEEMDGAVVSVELPRVQARYVKFRCFKFKRSPVTDFFFMGEVEVYDSSGNNIARGKKYSFYLDPPTGNYGDDGTKLTDGTIEGVYTDGLSVGWTTLEPVAEANIPVLVEIPQKKGSILVATTKFSDFRTRHYRLTRVWEILLRGIILYLFPEDKRGEVSSGWVNLNAYTDPRTWCVPEEEVELVVESDSGANIEISSPTVGKLTLESAKPGKWTASFTAKEGNHIINVKTSTSTGSTEQTVNLEVSPRDKKYREVLDRNIGWFMNSGVIPAPDGSKGIYTQRCMAWLDSFQFDGGPKDALGNPYRVDNNANSALAIYMYGELSGDNNFKKIAENVIQYMLPHQYSDNSKACFGGWPWLYENADTMFFHDDQTRVAISLLWFYMKTKNPVYLEAGLRTMELMRLICWEDGSIPQHYIVPDELNKIKRAAYRERSDPSWIDFDLQKWFWCYGITHDPAYKELAWTCAFTRGITMGGDRGSYVPYYYTGDKRFATRAAKIWKSFLLNYNVRKVGVPISGGGVVEQQVYTGDNTIGTTGNEPLSDQLYSTPPQLIHSWMAYKVTGEADCLKAFYRIGDYLARIQIKHPDKRLDGAWLRGFDFKNWEYYGAPYDPFYGAYSAYTGWMNSFTDIGYALYLLNASILPPNDFDTTEAQKILAKVRSENPPDRVKYKNIARGCKYTFDPVPDESEDTKPGKLTDGIIDGEFRDEQSLGWSMSVGGSLDVDVTVDLGKTYTIGMVCQRFGGFNPDYRPDKVEILTSDNGRDFQHAVDAPTKKNSVWISVPDVSCRYVRFRASKTNPPDKKFRLYVGEIQVLESK